MLKELLEKLAAEPDPVLPIRRREVVKIVEPKKRPVVIAGCLAARMAGSCRDGAERDGGRLYHGVRPVTAHYKAVCGAEPGRRSAGWSSYYGSKITCPRCKKRLGLTTGDEAMNLIEKLHPSRFPDMSGKMAAIVGCVMGEKFTEPSLAELCITSDGMVMGRTGDDIGFNAFIGAKADLVDNWTNLLDAAGLTDEERAEADLRFSSTVTRL